MQFANTLLEKSEDTLVKLATTAESKACKIIHGLLILHIIIACTSLLISWVIVHKIPTRIPVKVLVVSGTNEMKLQSFENIHIEKQETTQEIESQTQLGKNSKKQIVYQLTFPNGQQLKCLIKPNLNAPFPVDIANNKIHCQKTNWNRVKLQVKYKETVYSLTKETASPVEESVNTEIVLYYSKKENNMSSTHTLQTVRFSLKCLMAFLVYKIGLIFLRLHLIEDKYCDYKFSDELKTKYPDYTQKWQEAFKYVKINYVAEKIEQATQFVHGKAGVLGNDASDVVIAAAKAGRFMTLIKRWRADFEKNTALWKSRRDSQTNGGRMSYFLYRCASWFISGTLVGLVVYVLLSKRLQSKFNNNKIVLLITVISGLIGANLFLAWQLGHWREHIGLSFIDWPRVIF